MGTSWMRITGRLSPGSAHSTLGPTMPNEARARCAFCLRAGARQGAVCACVCARGCLPQRFHPGGAVCQSPCTWYLRVSLIDGLASLGIDTVCYASAGLHSHALLFSPFKPFPGPSGSPPPKQDLMQLESLWVRLQERQRFQPCSHL